MPFQVPHAFLSSSWFVQQSLKSLDCKFNQPTDFPPHMALFSGSCVTIFSSDKGISHTGLDPPSYLHQARPLINLITSAKSPFSKRSHPQLPAMKSEEHAIQPMTLLCLFLLALPSSVLQYQLLPFCVEPLYINNSADHLGGRNHTHISGPKGEHHFLQSYWRIKLAPQHFPQT